MSKGILFVVSGPSGCGKGTILAEILKDSNIKCSVSATTRAPNTEKGEIEGISYYFISKEEFEELIKNDDLLEYAPYCGNYYGTPKKPVEAMLDEGRHVILEIEVKGAMQIKEKYPEAVLVFILPPSAEELKRRLLKRGRENEEKILERLSKAEEEISMADKYNYKIVNDELSQAVIDLKSVIRAEELK